MPRDLSPQERWEVWLGRNPCPQRPEEGVHLWLLRAARTCQLSGVEAQQAADFITNGGANCGRVVPSSEIRERIKTAYDSEIKGEYGTRVAVPEFSLEQLTKIAEIVPLETVSDDYLASRSPECVEDIEPGQFLDAVFAEGEKVAVVHPYMAKTGTGFLYAHGNSEDAALLPDYAKRNKDGVWYISNPVTGSRDENGSIRNENCMTSYRHCVIESDWAKKYRNLWLKVLVLT
jgi:hypothetical protein